MGEVLYLFRATYSGIVLAIDLVADLDSVNSGNQRINGKVPSEKVLLCDRASLDRVSVTSLLEEGADVKQK
ncbi:MAG: hypothetical protein ACRD3N_02715 [Terracidiphilus sp.]